jgi:putative membrane protein
MTRTWFSSLAFAAAVTVACNGADRGNGNVGIPGNSDSTSQSVATASDNPTSEDRDFVDTIGVANMAEVELGKMALDHAANADVKKFAQMMVDDHTTAGDKLKAIATEHNLAMPAEVDVDHRDLRDRLAKLQGAVFDNEYMTAMVDGHEKVLGELEKRVDRPPAGESADQINPSATSGPMAPRKSDNATTMSINQWAADTYPAVRKHLEVARTLQRNMPHPTD